MARSQMRRLRMATRRFAYTYPHLYHKAVSAVAQLADLMKIEANNYSK